MLNRLLKSTILSCSIIFVICSAARLFEYFYMRTDETFLSENFIHKLFGILQLPQRQHCLPPLRPSCREGEAGSQGKSPLRWLRRCQGSGPAAGDSQGKYSNCREGGKKMSDHSSTPFHFSNGSQSKAAFIITRKPPEIQPVF